MPEALSTSKGHLVLVRWLSSHASPHACRAETHKGLDNTVAHRLSAARMNLRGSYLDLLGLSGPWITNLALEVCLILTTLRPSQ